MKNLFFLSIFLFLPFFQFAQTVNENSLDKKEFQKKSEFLLKEFGNNKIIPENIKIEALTALSFFPELKNIKIIFTGKKIRTTMQARPKNDILFKRKNKRTYYVYLNNNKGKHHSMDLGQFSYNSLVGILGHELSHVAYYSGKGSLAIAENGILYIISHSFREKFEKETDRTAIRHNLGFQLYENRVFLLTNPNITDNSKKRTRDLYLSPEEIIEIGHLNVK